MIKELSRAVQVFYSSIQKRAHKTTMIHPWKHLQGHLMRREDSRVSAAAMAVWENLQVTTSWAAIIPQRVPFSTHKSETSGIETLVGISDPRAETGWGGEGQRKSPEQSCTAPRPCISDSTEGLSCSPHEVDQSGKDSNGACVAGTHW